MKTTLIIVLAIVLIAYAGKMAVSFSPFKITMERQLEAIGVLFLAISLVCFKTQSDKDGYKRGVEDSVKTITKTIQKS